MSYLPNSVDYSEPLAVLPPDAINTLVSCSPINGSSFREGTLIQVDLGSRGFLDPASLQIRYKLSPTLSAAGIATNVILATPLYTPLNRLEVLVNSQTIESISNYSTVANMLVQLQMSVADKYGQASSLGIRGAAAGAEVTLESLDSRLVAIVNAGSTAGEIISLSGPLPCSLSNSEKLIPLFLLNNVRLQFTLDSAPNVSPSTGGAAAISAYTMSDFEVVYNMIDMGSSVQSEIIAMNPMIKIKSSSFSTATTNLPTGSAGTQSLVYNQKYASIKSAYVSAAGNDLAIGINRNFDAYDVTSGNGTYQLLIGNTAYPQRAFDTKNNKSGIFSKLRRAMGTLYGNSVALAINDTEFNRISAAVTTATAPAKFFVGFNLQKLTISSKAFFTGVSTQSTPITLLLNMNTATAQPHNVMLILNYDMIFEIDSNTKSFRMIQ